jgi:DNA-binding NtrC family response regulator
MTGTGDSVALPPALQRVATIDPALAEEVAEAFARLARAGEAMAWAQERLGALVAAGTPAAIVRLLVQEAQQLTGAPAVWAVTWTGSLEAGTVSFRALASARQGGGRAADDVPAPGEISRTIVGRVVAEGRPAWSDDAQSDARFEAAQSVQAFALRSVGCLAVGKRGALYLSDPRSPGRFALAARARLAALCALAGPFLDLEPGARGRARRAGAAGGGGAAAPGAARESPAEPAEMDGLVGASAAMGEVLDAIEAFAPMPWPALVLGETGTGKEVVARALHARSARRDGPFVAVNCGAIPEELAESTLFGHERGAFTGADRKREGLVERANGGTLFLDEVGELSARLQVKLLRLLQEGVYERVGGEGERRYEGRVLAATHRPLDDPARRGAFREDLYHRLAACVLRVPPLRERREDVARLADHLLAKALGELGGATPLALGEAARAWLAARDWPGNVRELENALRAAVARCLAQKGDVLEPRHFEERGAASAPAYSGSLSSASPASAWSPASSGSPSSSSSSSLAPASASRSSSASVSGAVSASASVSAAAAGGAGQAAPDGMDLVAATDAFQKAQVHAALQACDGNRTQAAARLGVTRQWLHRLLARWGDEPWGER